MSAWTGFRQHFFAFLFEGDKPSHGYRSLNRFINIIILSVATLLLEQIEWIRVKYDHLFEHCYRFSIFFQLNI